MVSFTTLDTVVLVVYLVALVTIGLFVSCRRRKEEDPFLFRTTGRRRPLRTDRERTAGTPDPLAPRPWLPLFRETCAREGRSPARVWLGGALVTAIMVTIYIVFN